MNERIKQLAEQAGFILWQDESQNPGDVIDWSCRYDDEFEKFAEMIVEECVMFIDTGADKFNDGDWLKTSVKDIGAMIKEHFGVENGIR